MDWESSSRSKMFGAAALLIAAAGLLSLPEASDPPLNESLGDLPAEASLKKAGNRRSAATGALGRFLDEFLAAGSRELRDAPLSPAGLSLPGHPLSRRSRSAAAARGGAATRGASEPREEGRASALPLKTSPSSGQLATRAGTGDPASSGRMKESKKQKPAADAFSIGGPRPASTSRRFGQRLMAGNPRNPGLDEAGSARGAGGAQNSRRPLQAAAADPAPPKQAAAERSSRHPRRRFRPLLLSRLLGTRAIRPPQGPVRVPDLSGLSGLVPKRDPAGRAWQPAPGLNKDVEAWRPPERSLTDCRKTKGHWHREPAAALYHLGKSWGMTAPGRFGWLSRQGGRWWAWTAPHEPTWLSYQGRWWWNSENVWFLLHEAEAWGYRLFLENRAEGLIHPTTGTRMIYSQDGSRVAVVTPGEGAVLFDAVTGRELWRWSEEQMKPPSKPSIPSVLTLPP